MKNVKYSNCYWYHEYQDMSASVPTCDYYRQYGECPCEPECEHFITKKEVDDIVRNMGKIGQTSNLIRRQDALKPFCVAPDGTRIPEVDCDNLPVEFSVEFIKKHLLSLPSAEAVDRHYIKIYADDEPSVKAEKLYQICGETQNREVAEWLKEYFPSTDDNWIPVSDRLPKQTDEYIVSVHYSRDSVWTDKFGYTPTTDGGWYDPEDTKQNMVDWNKYIVAWMPLPQPYKGGDDE